MPKKVLLLYSIYIQLKPIKEMILFLLACILFFLYGELTLPQPRFLPDGGCGKKQVFGAKASFVCHLPDDGQEI